MKKNYQYSVLGGTFDHLHKGHKRLIDAAFDKSQFVTIGLVAENLYQKKALASQIEPYNLRKKNLINYLKSKNFFKWVKIISISDIFGSTLKDEKLEAIFVTKDTRTNAIVINNERKKINLKPLYIVTVSLVLAQDGKPITSERIRIGEIDREGNCYDLRLMIKEKKLKTELVLPVSLRPRLQKPLGKLITNFSLKLLDRRNSSMVIAVGDIISASLEKEGFLPDVKIIDFRSRRQDLFELPQIFASNEKDVVINNPGTINLKAAEGIKNAMVTFLRTKKKQIIIVQGEEDLLALPAILYAPLNAVVLYGQMDQGVVMVEVSEEKKEEITEILRKFE